MFQLSLKIWLGETEGKLQMLGEYGPWIHSHYGYKTETPDLKYLYIFLTVIDMFHYNLYLGMKSYSRQCRSRSD